MAFKKGDANINRRGRPKKGKTWADVIKKIGAEKVDFDGKKATRLEVLARAVFEEAEKREPWAIHFLADRTDGKPIQQIIQDTDTHVHVTRSEVGVVSKDEDGKDIDLSDPVVE